MAYKKTEIVFSLADFIIFGGSAPLWLSWLGTIVTSYLAFVSFHFFRRLR